MSFEISREIRETDVIRVSAGGRNVKGRRHSVPSHGHLDGLAGRRLPDQSGELSCTPSALAVEFRDDVSLLQSGARGRTITSHFLNDDARVGITDRHADRRSRAHEWQERAL